MRNFRRLPSLLRVASIVGTLFPLAGIALMANSYVTGQSSSPPAYWDSGRTGVIALNLVWLSMACTFVAIAYSTGVRQPGLGPFPLGSWQSQVRAILLLSALPFCGIALALIIPPTSRAFGVVFIIFLLASIVLLAAFVALAAGTASSGPMRTPPTG